MPQRWTTFFAAVVLVAATAGVGAAQQESIEELRARADQGNAETQFNLGFMYANGVGVPQDEDEDVWKSDDASGDF
jgi:TPR repeat protein